MILVRVFNEAGMRRFRELLSDLRSGVLSEIPYDLLEDSGLTLQMAGAPAVGRNGIKTSGDDNVPTRMEAAKYLNDVLDQLEPSDLEKSGLWAWLSPCFLDQLCPPNGDGLRKIGKDYRLIPSGSWKDYYRHLLAGPFRLYRTHGDHARVFLGNPAHLVGDVNEQLASRQEIIGNHELIKAIDRLYYSAERANFKRGCTTKHSGGSIHRLVKVKRQLDLTYDLFSTTHDEILNLLPPEFDKWKQSA